MAIQLKPPLKLEFNRFVILSVDESSAGASGCSIDGSVRVLRIWEINAP